MRIPHTVSILAAVLMAVGSARQTVADNEKPHLSSGVFSIADYGAAGDGMSKETAAIQKAIDAANNSGGGAVYFPPGTHLSGTIYLNQQPRSTQCDNSPDHTRFDLSPHS